MPPPSAGRNWPAAHRADRGRARTAISSITRSIADHPLRPAEAAEGGVGDGVGLQPARMDLASCSAVAIVGVEHGAVGDRAARGRRNSRSAPRGRSGCRRSGPRRRSRRRSRCGNRGACRSCTMSSSRSSADLGRPAGLGARPSAAMAAISGRLGLLAAEAAAHAADLDRDRRCRTGRAPWRRCAGPRLGCWVERMDQHVAALAGHGERGLAFEVEMLLPADMRACRRGGAARAASAASASPQPHVVRRQRGRHRRRARRRS